MSCDSTCIPSSVCVCVCRGGGGGVEWGQVDCTLTSEVLIIILFWSRYRPINNQNVFCLYLAVFQIREVSQVKNPTKLAS